MQCMSINDWFEKITGGLFEAFGFTPGEATIVEEQVVPRSQELVA